jgi:endonuclease/exonuclease/phosphatase (EEP) superfamily protein YafD
MTWWDTALLALGLLAIVATVLPLWTTDRWWVRVCDFPRNQIAILAAAILAAFAITGMPRTWWAMPLAAALVLVIVWQASWIWRYLPIAPRQVERSRRPADDPARLALLTANVLQSNRDARRLPGIIAEADPDVVLAVEVDEWWCRQLCAALAERYPHQVLRPQSNTYGMALFSRLPLVEPEVRCLIEDGIPSIRTGVTLPSGDVVDLHCVHPRPPRPGEDTAHRDAELVVVAREIKARGRPAIVMGDLNDVAWSRTTLMLERIGGCSTAPRPRLLQHLSGALAGPALAPRLHLPQRPFPSRDHAGARPLRLRPPAPPGGALLRAERSRHPGRAPPRRRGLAPRGGADRRLVSAGSTSRRLDVGQEAVDLAAEILGVARQLLRG